MATRSEGLAVDAERTAGTFPTPWQDSFGRRYLEFPDSADAEAAWTRVAAQGLTGTLTLYVRGMMATANANTIRLYARVEAVTPSDARDLDANSYWDTSNAVTSATVPGTAGYEFETAITLTNKDSIAAGDTYRIMIGRNPGHANDGASGAFRLRAWELRDAA